MLVQVLSQNKRTDAQFYRIESKDVAYTTLTSMEYYSIKRILPKTYTITTLYGYKIQKNLGPASVALICG